MNQINQDYIFLAIVGILMAMMGVFMGIYITRATTHVFSNSSSDGQKAFCRMLERANALQMSTVILIVVGACALRVVNDIPSDAVVSILSGVAGYVLGGSSLSTNSSKDNTEKDR